MNTQIQPPLPRPYFVYELVHTDPDARIDSPFYIGMTNDPKGRFAQHAAGDDNKRKTKMFQAAKYDPDFKIAMRILDTTIDGEEAKRLEAFWIMYRTLEGYTLYNTQAGVCFSLYEIDIDHQMQLRKMLRIRFGESQQSKIETKQVYVAPNTLTNFKDFFAHFWG